MYKLTNVSTDHRFAMQRRTAPRLQMEPPVMSTRLRLGKSLLITDAYFARNKVDIEKHRSHGVLVYEQVSVDGPTNIEVAGPPVSGENAVLEMAEELVVEEIISAPVVVEEPPTPVPVVALEEKPVERIHVGKKDKRR